MKKGAIHLDWVISIGIFLMYILFFFIFISPFYKSPTQEGVIMLDILEDNFREEVYWNVTKMPIFIDCDACGDETSIEEICLPSFPFSIIGWGESEILLTDNTDNSIGFRIQDKCENNGQHPPDGPDDLVFNYGFNNEMIDFWMIYNEGGNYLSPEWICINEVEGICNFLQYDPDGTPPDGTGDYVYYYGLAEKIFGISENKIDNNNKRINGLDYESIKEKWKFPTGTDFQIVLNKIVNNSEVFSLKEVEYYEQANVYVREWSDYILNEDGTKEAIKINIAVWR